MLMGDGRIRELIANGVIIGADDGGVGPVAYDLRTRAFYADGKLLESVALAPGDSVFVGSEEVIDLPDDLACRVLLKNSRIRLGLSLDAPLYFPGHKTRVFFRVTNVSGDVISLDKEKGIASIAFEDVQQVDNPYEGAFTGEFDFKGLAAYRDVYKGDVEKIERKADEIEGVERRMYGNVIVLMGIFVGVFSLVNVNVMSSVNQASAQFMVAMNLATVGSLAALFALVSLMLHSDANSKRRHMAVSCAVAVIAFAAAAVAAGV